MIPRLAAPDLARAPDRRCTETRGSQPQSGPPLCTTSRSRFDARPALALGRLLLIFIHSKLFILTDSHNCSSFYLSLKGGRVPTRSITSGTRLLRTFRGRLTAHIDPSPDAAVVPSSTGQASCIMSANPYWEMATADVYENSEKLPHDRTETGHMGNGYGCARAWLSNASFV